MAGIKERLVQLTLRAKEFLSRDVQPASDALQGLVDDSRNLKDALNEAGRARGLARTLRDSEGATDSLRQAWKDAQATLEDLTREVGDSEQATAGQRIALREARRSADEAQAAYDRSQRAIKNLRTELKALNVDTDNIAAEEQRLTAEIEQNKRALDTNRDAIKRKREEEKKAADTAKEHASRVGAAREAMSSGARQVLAFAATFVGLNALLGLAARGFGLLRDGIGQMLQTGDQFEGLQVRMNALMGSVAAGEAATAWVKDFAKRTPLELQDVTDAFAQLQAYGVDPMNGTLQALVDQNEKLGGGMERLGGIIGAVGQAYAKQKLQTEEILQLLERGVPVWDMLAKVTGKNAAQLQDLATKGKLGRDVLAALIKEIGKSSTGAAEAGMSRLSGIISNLKDQATDFYNRIANAGALEYVKGQLKQLSDRISQMAADGSLDALAKGLSDAFVKGVEKAKELAAGLEGVDFASLAGKAESAVEKIGAAVDGTVTAGRYAVGTLGAVWNGFSAVVTATAATVIKAVQLTVGSAVLGAGQIAGFFGGDELKGKAEGLYTFLGELSSSYVAQAKTDLGQMAGAFDFANEKAKDGAAEQTKVVRAEADIQRQLNQAVADQLVANQQRVKDAAISAAADGTKAIAGIAEAVSLIDSASSVQQLESLRGALLTAFQAGTLGQQEYAQATTLLNGRLKELGSAAGGAAGLVSDLDEKLGDLAQVQAAISNAKTDVDINNIRSALRKLYNDGAITAGQYNEELKKTSERQKELKSAVDEGGKAQRGKNEADKEAIVTSEQLRRESGKRMEAERQAGDQAMQDRRKGSEEAKRDMSAMAGFFGGVMSRAREPLAAMSAAALDAFNALRGIKAADVTIDTSSLEATSDSLGRVARELEQVKAAAAMPMVSSLGRWQLETQRASLETQAAFLGQKASLQGLMERYESGSLTVRQFVSEAKAAKSAMSLLDDSDLSALQAAIRAAESQMKQMEQSTRSTLDGLQDELDQLAGREADIERRRFATRKRELQGQLAEAQAGGNAEAIANASRAMGMLRQIEAASAQKRQADEQKQRMEANKPAAAEAAPQPRKIVRLELNGKAVDVAVANDQDETSLLSILEDVAKRSL